MNVSTVLVEILDTTEYYLHSVEKQFKGRRHRNNHN
jgi:hypothetical protein